MSILTIKWQNTYCTATTLSFLEINWIWIVIELCFWIADYFVYCLYWTCFGVFGVRVLNTLELAWIRLLVESSVTKRLSRLCSSEKLSPVKVTKDLNRLLLVSILSFWCVMELLRIKNFLIGEGRLFFGQKKFLSPSLSVKSSWLINHVFPEIGYPFREWSNLLVIYHMILLIFVI